MRRAIRERRYGAYAVTVTAARAMSYTRRARALLCYAWRAMRMSVMPCHDAIITAVC